MLFTQNPEDRNMFLVTVTVEDTDTKRIMLSGNFPVRPGYNREPLPMSVPCVDKDGVILYSLEVLTFANKEDERWPAAALLEEYPK